METGSPVNPDNGKETGNPVSPDNGGESGSPGSPDNGEGLGNSDGAGEEEGIILEPSLEEIVSEETPTETILEEEAPSANPAIKVTMSVNGSSYVKPGDNVTFSIKVENTGNVDFTTVAVSDTLPDGLTFVSAAGNPMAASPNVVWVLTGLAAEKSYTFDVIAKVDDTAVETAA